ncbi:hypothetical protein [Streptomyces sp. NBC_01304]|uniref:hypothetical protein n=1 Tax=Streptomyces sp. NBC_01304 TaxID=2903818 RepID=UPI003FA3A816
MSIPVTVKAALTGTTAALLLGLGAPHALADSGPAVAADGTTTASDASRAAAHKAAAAPGTLDTLSRFFARDGALTKAAVDPRIEGAAVPVYYLSPEFVAGKKGAPIGRLQFLASKAVASDGQEASLWTVKQGAKWQVVNIATGDDESHYARVGADKLPGGTVFREPQIDAWYVQQGTRVLPLDADAKRAVGAGGTSLTAYQDRVEEAYGDKLPGSAYAKSGKAGGYGKQSGKAAAPQAAAAPASTDPAVTVASTAAGLGGLLALVLVAARALRKRR